MRLLCAFLLLLTVSAEGSSSFMSRPPSFRGHFQGYPMCRRWGCLHEKLTNFNLTTALPPKDQYIGFLKGLLPAEWHVHADNAVDKCYEFKATWNYTNTCTGQGLLHCVVDKLVEDCPSEYWQSGDGCTRVTSLAGINDDYMFTQSGDIMPPVRVDHDNDENRNKMKEVLRTLIRYTPPHRYENLRADLPLEIRHAGFLPYFFTSKCCDLPQLFNASLLSECGFTEMLHYFYRKPELNTSFRYGPSMQDVTTRKTDGNKIGEVFNFHMLPGSTTIASRFVYSTTAGEDNEGEADEEILDALDCCEQIDDFIQRDWRVECDFKLKWDSVHRFTNRHYADDKAQNSTEQCKDLTPATSCVLNKMGLLNQFGFINYFGMKDKIREYSNYKPSYLYEVLKSSFMFVPRYGDLCDSPRKLYNLLDAMLLVCDPSKRRTNRQCNKMFTEITNSTSNKTREALDDIIYRNSNQNSGYAFDRLSSSRKVLLENLSQAKFDIVSNNERYDFGVLGLLGTPPPVSLLDLKPKNKTLVLLPVYQRTPQNDTLNSLHNDGVLRG